jgi:hypothetical protein
LIWFGWFRQQRGGGLFWMELQTGTPLYWIFPFFHMALDCIPFICRQNYFHQWIHSQKALLSDEKSVLLPKIPSFLADRNHLNILFPDTFFNNNPMCATVELQTGTFLWIGLGGGWGGGTNLILLWVKAPCKIKEHKGNPFWYFKII